jgi:hypothetical protein
MEMEFNRIKLSNSKDILSIDKISKLITVTFLKKGIVLKCEDKTNFGSVVRFSIIETTFCVYLFGIYRIAVGDNEEMFLKFIAREQDNLIYKIVNKNNEDCHFMKGKNSSDIVIISLPKRSQKIRLKLQ